MNEQLPGTAGGSESKVDESKSLDASKGGFVFAEPEIITPQSSEVLSQSSEAHATIPSNESPQKSDHERGMEALISGRDRVVTGIANVKGFFGKLFDRSKGAIGRNLAKFGKIAVDATAVGVGVGLRNAEATGANISKSYLQLEKKGADSYNRTIESVTTTWGSLKDKVTGSINEYKRRTIEKNIDQRFSGRFNNAVANLQSEIDATTAESAQARQAFNQELTQSLSPEQLTTLRQNYLDGESRRVDRVTNAKLVQSEELRRLQSVVSRAKRRFSTPATV